MAGGKVWTEPVTIYGFTVSRRLLPFIMISLLIPVTVAALIIPSMEELTKAKAATSLAEEFSEKVLAEYGFVPVDYSPHRVKAQVELPTGESEELNHMVYEGYVVFWETSSELKERMAEIDEGIYPTELALPK